MKILRVEQLNENKKNVQTIPEILMVRIKV
jgi:hypothetical protein